ncbi:hypothetical protein [Streptomyces gibsoniae]|uniref:Uncharacterized protein n=1 Tax=Streptomyces gibsoniae TaxID=3075529 RepID=A0ABU2TVD1_9ACTN|nr:hypothetical protein [Streptomyces sp. DSM 41699]MDT0464932.1 hypothetical protein [Streptomyces sp. DSM 41699]
MRASDIREALAAALGTEGAERLREVTAALELLADALAPAMPSRP